MRDPLLQAALDARHGGCPACGKQLVGVSDAMVARGAQALADALGHGLVARHHYDWARAAISSALDEGGPRE